MHPSPTFNIVHMQAGSEYHLFLFCASILSCGPDFSCSHSLYDISSEPHTITQAPRAAFGATQYGLRMSVTEIGQSLSSAKRHRRDTERSHSTRQARMDSIRLQKSYRLKSSRPRCYQQQIVKSVRYPSRLDQGWILIPVPLFEHAWKAGRMRTQQDHSPRTENSVLSAE